MYKADVVFSCMCVGDGFTRSLFEAVPLLPFTTNITLRVSVTALEPGSSAVFRSEFSASATVVTLSEA